MQIMVAHDIKMDRPTKHGRKVENNKTETPMHTDVNGNITLFQPNQHQLLDRKGKVNT